jgi:transcriptional regulator with XRE-family HTH domain
MPRRKQPHPLAAKVGRRIRQLRREAGLTMEKLAYESDLGSKGHLSNLERGLVLPTIETLRALAERLNVLPVDLLNVQGDNPRAELLEVTRLVPPKDVQMLLARAKRRSLT